MSICEGGRPTLVATTTTTGMRAATAPLTLIRAVRSATRTQTVTTNRCTPPAAAFDDLLSDPGGHPGRVEGLADDEEAGDEHDGRVAEARQSLTKIENAGEPERYRDTDGDDAERHAVGDEGHDGQRQDGEGHRHWAHGRDPIGNDKSPVRRSGRIFAAIVFDQLADKSDILNAWHF